MRRATTLILAALMPMAASAAAPNASPMPAPSTASASAATPSAPATAPSADKPLLERALRVDNVLLAPQPTAADFAALQGAGVRRVINLRATEEMATLGFDAQAAAEGAGLDYATLPIAGNAAFSPALLDAFAAMMAKGEGDLLLHCASGARAGQLYAAWLVREKGLSPQEAMERVAPLGVWPTPMERMLGRPLVIDYAPTKD